MHECVAQAFGLKARLSVALQCILSCCFARANAADFSIFSAVQGDTLLSVFSAFLVHQVRRLWFF
jgi:hypothetical protein